MSNKKLLKRLISYAIVLVFMFQCTLGVVAENFDKNQLTDKAAKEIKQELPKQAKVKNEKVNKIPPGLAKKQDAFEKWKGKKEVVENRTETSKTYMNDDGTLTSAIFMKPIHIKDHKGNLIDIDNTLVPLKTSGKYSHKNKLGRFDVLFSGKETKNGSIKVEKDNISIELTAMDAITENMVVEETEVLYQSTKAGVEHLYSVGFNGIKEDIILYQCIDEPVFTYELDVNGPADVTQQEGTILVTDKKSGEIIYTISAPFMEDREGNQSFNVALNLNKDNGKNIITVTADKEWLKDPARVYPVKVDPSIGVASTQAKSISVGESLVDDNFVQEKSGGFTHKHEFMMYVGYDDGKASRNYELYKTWKENTNSFIKFTIPSKVPQNADIVSATMGLYKYTTWLDNLNVKRNMDVWELPSTSKPVDSLIWSNQPKPTASTRKMTVPIGIAEDWYRLDVMQFVDTWIKNPSSNYGLGMSMQGVETQAECFYSSNHTNNSKLPYLEIVYNVIPPVEDPPTEVGDLDLVLERSDIMENGTAKAKGSVTASGENRVTINYKLMPDGPTGELQKLDIGTWDWETEKFDLEVDKTYWIEAIIKVEEKVYPAGDPPPAPYYKVVSNETKKTSKFVVGEAQPGDTLKRLSRHYLKTGTKSTEIYDLNKLKKEALVVRQKLFVITDISKALSYKQPKEITKDIELMDAAAGSEPVNTELVGQYINPHTGNFAYSNVDFSYPVYDLDMTLARSHNAILENRKSPMGDKWDYSFNKYIFFHKDGTIGYNTGDGSRIYFKSAGGNVYKTTAPVYDVLTDNGTYYEIKTANNTRYQFGKTGLLTKVLDKNNNETKVDYNDHDWQTEITDPTSRKITFDYYETGLDWIGNISSITMPNNVTIQYSYAPGGNTLTGYVDPDGYNNSYTYDDKQRMLNLTSGRGIVSIKNTYDTDGRVQTQKNGVDVPVSLVYNAGRTEFKDGRSKLYYFNYNSSYWLTKKEYPKLVSLSLSESYTHNDKGDIKTRTDRKNQTFNYEYNDLGYVTKFTRPDTKYMEYGYKNNYLLQTIKDFEGNDTVLHYDGNNNLEKEVRKVTENGSKVEVITNFSFNAKGLINSVTDPDEVTTTFDNSMYPYYQKVTDENNNSTKYYFDSMGNLYSTVDPKGNMTTTALDNRGNATFNFYPSSEDAARYEMYDYDGNSNLISQTSSRFIPEDGKLPTTTYDYDNHDRLTKVTDPYGNEVIYTYDGNDNLDTEKDQISNITKYEYDDINRLLHITYPGQSARTYSLLSSNNYSYSYTYDELGNVKTITEADGNKTEYDYNYDVNKVKTITKPENYSVSYQYDSMGNVETEIMPDKNVVTYDYDELYRVKTIVEPGSKTTNVNYKKSGRVSNISDYTGKTFDYNYYSNGQLQKTNEKFTDPLTSQQVNYEVVYTYDANGNMNTVKDEQGRTTTYIYNEINKVAEVKDPLDKKTIYTYDESGNVKTTKDGEDNVTITQYDALNRLYKVSVPAEETTHTYLYNTRGMLEYYIDPMENKTTYNYNPVGKLEKITNAKLEEVKYDYYPDGTLKKVTYPNQQYEEYNYDGLNRAVNITDRAGVVQTVDYTVTGQPDLISDTVGNKLDYHYDQYGRVETISDALNRTQTFAYDNAGNVKKITGMDNSTTQYTYDPRGRVRKVLDAENKPTVMDYNGGNQVTVVTKPGDRKYTYDYDNSGNLWRVTDPAQNKTEYFYNNNNQVKEILDARGYSKRYEYNDLNKLEKVINERTFETTYDYYPGGHLKTVKDPKGNETSYEYDKLNRVAIMENALDEPTTYDYDNMGNVKSITDPRGVKTSYTYNARDQIEYTHDNLNNFTFRSYYPNGDLQTITDEENNTTTYQYDAVHRVTKEIEPGNYVKNYVYNPVTGNVDRMYDNSAQSTTYTYDTAHRLLTETNIQGQLTQYTYDDFGNLETKKTPDGNTVVYDYDVLDRVTSILDPESKLTEMHYDSMGNIDYVIKPENQKYTYTYDGANNVEKIVDPLGQSTIYTYDKNDNVATMLDPSGNLFTYDFDALNRLKSVIDSTKGGSQYTYDEAGNITSIIDGNNNTTEFGYDNVNRLEWVKDGEGNVTSYTYFKDGKLKSMTDGNENTSSYTYDAAGNLASYTNPLDEVKTFQYTLLNQIRGITNADDTHISYDYDQYNRLENISYPSGDDVEYKYDSLNRKTQMADINGVTDYSYDSMNRLTSVTDAASENVKYEYDSKGRKSKIIYPDGKSVKYAYDSHDRLETVTDREGKETKYTYDEADRLKTTSLPNGIVTTYTYDKSNRIVEIDNKGKSGSTVEKISYGYDAVGNKTKEEIWKEDKHFLREYTYYKNNTIKDMTESGDNATTYKYEYDKAGNIVKKVVTEDESSKTYDYIYNEANRMTEEKENGVTRRLYRYDERGNRTEIVIGIGEDGNEEADTYYYDDADRLIQITEHNGKMFTYGYDGEGNRLWRTYSQTPVIKNNFSAPAPAPVPGNKGNGRDNAPGQNKEKDNNGNGNDKGNDKKSGAIESTTGEETASESLSMTLLAGSENGNGNDKDKDNGNGKDDSDKGNGKDNGNGNGKGNDNGNGNGKGNSNNGKAGTIDGKDKNIREKGVGWAKGKDKSKAKGSRGKHLGWYKKITHPNNPGGIDVTEPEVFEVTNYINDVNREHTEVLMTSDVDGNYWAAYTYGRERISAEDLVSIEGVPNNPLYYLHDALGTTTSITNMNNGVIDSNRFAPYGEPIDPVAKNSRRSNSSFGFTGEAHDIEAGLVYLRARYYEPGTMRFLQQDTMFGDIKEPLTRNLYIYGNANPLTYVDPSGHVGVDNSFTPMKYGDKGPRVKTVQKALNVWTFIMFEENYSMHLRQLTVNGDFDSRTKARVNTFKTENKINNTGSNYCVVDQATWNALKPYMSEDDTESEKGKTYVTNEQLLSIGFQNVNNKMANDLNRVLEKYDITTIDRIQHFIAQAIVETEYGKGLTEWGSDAYFAKKPYGKKYSGAGYIHLTWDYGYQAFATYLILERYPDLKGSANYKNPNSNDKKTILKEYEKVIKAAKEKGYNIIIFTDIVNIGREHVAENFAWESAGYFWAIGKVNMILDNNKKANDDTRVDSVTAAVNKYTDSYQKRRDAYQIVKQHIK